MRHDTLEHPQGVRVIEIFEDDGQARKRQPWQRQLLGMARNHGWFLGIAVLPTVLAALYFGLIAADLYMSEARFIVRKAGGESSVPLSGLLQTAGLAPTANESLSIHDFMLSRDAVQRLQQRVELRSLLQRPEADFLMRFPRPFGGDSAEQLHKRYEDFVAVTVDSSSGISTLRVKAFRPDDAHGIAMALLKEGEDLVNRLNRRAQRDTIELTRSEVDRAERRVIAAQKAITDYRQRTKIVDPASGSAAVLQLVGTLSAELAATQAALAQTRAASPQSPQIGALRDRINALEAQITRERSKVVGDDKSIVGQISEYERLAYLRQFAERQLTSAQSALELARVEAQRKHLYIERIVEPNRPDYALYPRRLYSFLVVAITAFLIFGIGRLLSASVKEHVGR